MVSRSRGMSAHNVIVAGSAARVDEEQTAVGNQPVLLRVVVAEILSVVKLPGSDGLEMQTILAAGDETSLIVADRQEVLTVEAC